MKIEQVLDQLVKLKFEQDKVARQIRFYVDIANSMLNGNKTCEECEYCDDDCERYEGGEDE